MYLYSLYSLLVIGCLLLVKHAYAVCPVCIVAVGAGVGLAEEFGVDDTIVGLWVGALIIAMAWWTVNWLKQSHKTGLFARSDLQGKSDLGLIKKNWCFKGCSSITFLAYYSLTLAPLYSSGIIGKELNTLWGIDKLLLGVLAGSTLFYAGESLHFYIKSKNNDKVHFYFQRVIIPVIVLIIASGAFYLITK